jgi:glycosyltransferase involved in cell wall biosynthesis
MKEAGDTHGRALDAMRAGEWMKAASLLEPVASRDPEPWIVNDLAVALHQAGRDEEAVKKLRLLGDEDKLPAIVRLNRMYLEKAVNIAAKHDLNWEHKDHDGIACPDVPPLVSVIVRTYKRPDFLKEALASLKAQTFTGFETIVVNDGGDPSSEAVVRGSGLANARYVMMEHRGRVETMNTGLEMAHGRYVTGLDDDDVLYPRHMAAMVECLESPGAAPVAYSDYRVVTYRETENGELSPASKKDFIWDDYRPGYLFDTNPFIVSIMARRSCYKKVGRFIPALELAEDWEMWLRLADDFDIHHLSEVTVEVRERPGDENITNRRMRQKYFWDNLVIMMHKGLVAASAPARPELSEQYQKGMAMLDGLIAERPEVLPLINLRGLWNMKKAYSWFADHGRWFKQLGETELSRRFYGMAARLDPLQPKVWAGWLRSLGA